MRTQGFDNESMEIVEVCEHGLTVTRIIDGPFHFELQHGDNPEARQAFDVRSLLTGEAMRAVSDWIEEIHVYESAGR